MPLAQLAQLAQLAVHLVIQTGSLEYHSRDVVYAASTGVLGSLVSMLTSVFNIDIVT